MQSASLLCYFCITGHFRRRRTFKKKCKEMYSSRKKYSEFSLLFPLDSDELFPCYEQTLHSHANIQCQLILKLEKKQNCIINALLRHVYCYLLIQEQPNAARVHKITRKLDKIKKKGESS
jgi:hypothetical protein